MPFLMGTDEAGYGPNLGPLVITGTLWKYPGWNADLYDALQDAVKPTGSKSRDDRIVIADSKQVYSSGSSMIRLEESVLSVVTWQVGRMPTSLIELVDIVAGIETRYRLQRASWMDGADLQLPLVGNIDAIQARARQLAKAADEVDVSLVGSRSTILLPDAFNRGVEAAGNKATLLSQQTMNIVAELKNKTDDDLEIVCDKHGGRSKYAGLIQHTMTQQLVHVGEESRQHSEYSFRELDRDVVIRFCSGGESFLPTALASMISKYLREALMEIWNTFWTRYVPDLKPTKGYPVDAKRFMSDIESTQRKLGIKSDEIWRSR